MLRYYRLRSKEHTSLRKVIGCFSGSERVFLQRVREGTRSDRKIKRRNTRASVEASTQSFDADLLNGIARVHQDLRESIVTLSAGTARLKA